MKKIAIVDVGIGNVTSIARAVENIGHYPVLVTKPCESHFDFIIIPGAGSAGYYLHRLHSSGMATFIKQSIEEKINVLGICLGMQILGRNIEEDGGVQGLNVLPFDVVANKRCALNNSHTGWENMHEVCDLNLSEATANNKQRLYYNHRYSCKLYKHESSVTYINNKSDAVAAMHVDNIFVTQFHPEKSQKFGINILKEILV